MPADPTGIRFYRRDDLDEQAAPEAGLRSERIRELVDELQPFQRHIIERTFFGQATLVEACDEWGVGVKLGRRAREDGLLELGRAMLLDDSLGPVLAAHGLRDAEALLGALGMAAEGPDA